MSRTLNICIAYRPPNMSTLENTAMMTFLDSKFHENVNWLLLGDFNYPSIDWFQQTSTVAQEETFLDFANEHNLTQHVLTPTRGENILDLVMSVGSFQIDEVTVHETFSTSDHNIITAKILTDLPTMVNKEIRDFKNTDWSIIHMHLACIDWNNFFYNNSDVNEMWNQFSDFLNYLIDLYVPLKSISPGKSAPWFDRNLKKMSKKKRSLYHRYKAQPTTRNHRKYNDFCKSFKKAVQYEKANYERKKFLKRKSDPKQFFSYIENKSKTKTGIPNLRVDDQELNSDAEKVAALRAKFSSVFTEDDGVLPDFSQVIPEDSFTQLLIDDNEVFLAISSLANNFSTGADGICAIFVKKLKTYLTRPLTEIFRCSMNSGIIPEDWKKSVIVPVYKPGSLPYLVDSYRPIALTSVIVKILEKIIRKNVIMYLELNDVSFTNQHGFLSEKSTLTNLIETLNYFTKKVDERSNVDALYIDVSKAFDSISHNKLIYKLKKYGFGGIFLLWIENFLTNRPQRVKINSELSPMHISTSGVPQGSILGPLFFILYIDGICEKLTYGRISLYADDAKIFGEVNDTSEWNRLQDDVLEVNNFLTAWQLKVNPNKSEVIHLGPNNANLPYNINGEPIQIRNECRDLGIITNNCFSTHSYCKSIVKKAAWKCKQLSIAFECKTREFKVFIFTTYIRPLLENNTQLWSPHNICDINLIEKIQRRFTKFLPGLWNTPYPDRLDILGLQSLECRRIIFDLILVYKIIHGLIKLNFHDFFQFNQNNTRGHNLKLCVEYSRLNSRKFFFTNRVIKIWNDLESHEVNSTSLIMFKRKMYAKNFRSLCRGSGM